MAVRNFLGEAWAVGKSFAQGMSVTFEEMVFKEPVTLQYPKEKDPTIPPWFRGIPLQKTDLTSGAYKCTSCGLCVTACPVDVITLEWKQNPETRRKEVVRYAIDMSRCMLCNFCIEACPFDSLVMGQDYELAKVNPENMVYEFEDLLRMGLKYSAPEGEDWKWGSPVRGTPPWIFHEFTGATEEDMPEGAHLGTHPKAEVRAPRPPRPAAAPAAEKPAAPAAEKPAPAAAKPAAPTAEAVAPTAEAQAPSPPAPASESDREGAEG